MKNKNLKDTIQTEKGFMVGTGAFVRMTQDGIVDPKSWKRSKCHNCHHDKWINRNFKDFNFNLRGRFDHVRLGPTL